MVFKNEEKIIKIIKYTPPLFVVLFACIISLVLLIDNKITFNKEKEKLENDYLLRNQELVKNDVEMAYNYISKQQVSMENRLKQSLKNRVNEAYIIAMEIYHQNQHLGKETVTKLIKDALVNVRFNEGRGYYFIYSMDYECILLPINRSLEGTSFYNFKEGRGEYLTRNIVEIVRKNKEGYLTWWFPKPSDLTTSYKKIGFNKYFEPLDWFIGTGEYFDEFEQSTQKKVLNDIEEMMSMTNNKYLFILTQEGVFLSHPQKELVGKSLLEQNSLIGENNKHEAINNLNAFKQLSKEGGFHEYAHLNENKKWLMKTSYVKGVDKWDWILGKGFYESDVAYVLQEKQQQLKEEFNKQLLNIFLIALVLIVLLLMLSSYVSRLLQAKFKGYKQNIQAHIQKDKLQQELLFQQSKMAAMGEMIGNIAHQWRQPLSAITLSATTLELKNEMNSLNKEEVDVHVQNITHSAQYLSTTIDDFRNFFKPHKEKNEFTIQSAIEKTLKLVYVQFKNKEIEIIKNIHPTPLYSYENELVQVLINVLNNAKDELEKKAGPKLIFIDTYTKENQLFIEIKDNALGIPVAIINRIFEPYFTTKHQKQGTGIGLYMSSEIVTKHLKGEIKAQNTQFKFNNKTHKGALITITLPLGEPHAHT
ncbi:MAG: cache domain-containing protein [Arcobacteraceae bacterium]